MVAARTAERVAMASLYIVVVDGGLVEEETLYEWSFESEAYWRRKRKKMREQYIFFYQTHKNSHIRHHEILLELNTRWQTEMRLGEEQKEAKVTI